jgi:hypothetical protein
MQSIQSKILKSGLSVPKGDYSGQSIHAKELDLISGRTRFGASIEDTPLILIDVDGRGAEGDGG